MPNGQESGRPGAHPGSAPPAQASPGPPGAGAGHTRAAEEGDATGGVIPYKNPPALVAYYLGVFSLIPFLGAPLGVAALILGILGLKRRREAPAVKGAVHAWIGIVAGGGLALLWISLLALPLLI